MSTEGSKVKEQPKEMTWTRAILYGMGITVFFVIFLGFIPSQFTYWWEDQTDSVVEIVSNLTNREIEAYTSVRIRDAISMGYQTVVFVAALGAVYFKLEKRRRRLGQQGFAGVKDYLSGK